MPQQDLEDLRSRLAAIVDSSNDAIISKNLDGVISTWNRAAHQLFAYSEAEAIGQPITLIIPVDLHDEEKEILRRVRAGERLQHYETRRVTRDGRVLDVSISVSPIRNVAGIIVGASTILRDMSYATLNQRLINAQEEERSRIARELHDDIGQRLALLSISLDAIARTSGTSATDGRPKIEAALQEVMHLAKDVQALSHRLHPARLEYLGIEAAAEALCREVSTQGDIDITFSAERVADSVPRSVAVCLYRVLQEALQNAVKHSGMRRIEVTLRGGPDEIALTVRDAGAGFDVEAAQRRGLGLTTMKERVTALKGRLSVMSEPQHGTTILASVPLMHEAQKAPGESQSV